MKKQLLLMTALLFISGASMAQKVVEAGGKAVIDNRAMPAKAITTEKKARIIPINNPNTTLNIASAETNKTVSHYFEVMKFDYNGGAIINWLTAIRGCENYDSGDGNRTWRLPVQRELQLIWTLHKTLMARTNMFVSFRDTTYWSATEKESTSIERWSVNFGEGFMVPYSKDITYHVRCVRDLIPPA